MNYIDQEIKIDEKKYVSLCLDSIWPSLEEAAKQLELAGYSAMSELGSMLGAALIPTGSDNAELLIANLVAAQHDNGILRLSFTGLAAKLPVEFTTLSDELMQLCKAEGIAISDAALGLHPSVELIRVIGEVQQDRPPVKVTEKEPLRILIAVANPDVRDWPKITRAEPQARVIEAACRGIDAAFVDVTVLTSCTRQSLTKALKDTRPHILHFVGHGAYVTDGVDEPSLVLESLETREFAYMSGKELLALCPTVPEVITLSACHLGRTDPLVAGLAETLTAAGVPVVLAMQLPVLETSVEHVAEYIYRPLLRSLSVAQALAHVRRQIAIDARLRHHPLWATPVLYTAVSDTARFTGIPASQISETRSRANSLRFVGREWLWGEVTRYLESPNQKIFLLEADAGMGKSSFLEFCRWKLEDTIEISVKTTCPSHLLISHNYHDGGADSVGCAQGLSSQIKSWLAENDKPVPVEPSSEALGSPYARACEILKDLIAAVTKHINVILLIDALDEAREAGEALPIADQLGRLPENVAVLIAARPAWYTQWQSRYAAFNGADGSEEDSRFSLVRISPLSTGNLQDIAYFLFRAFAPFNLGFKQTECIQLAKDVKGNFLLADILCGLLYKGVVQSQVKDWFNEADSVAGGYHLAFRELGAMLGGDVNGQRILSDAEDLLALVTCAQGRITEEQLHHLFKAREQNPKTDITDVVAIALSHLRRFLSSDITEYGELRYGPYHGSFRTYGELRLGIKSESDSPGSAGHSKESSVAKGLNELEAFMPKHLPERLLPRTAQTYRKLWADYCRKWSGLDRYPRTYALRHLVPHLNVLEGEGPNADIDSALMNYAYIAAALGADPTKPERPLTVHELIAYYEQALRRCPQPYG